MALRFRAGDLDIQRIVEMEGPFLPATNLFPSLSAETLERERASLEAQGALVAGTEVLAICVQSYVVRTPHHVVLIDSCVGNDKRVPTRAEWNGRTGTTYMDALSAAGLGVDDIDIVLCTHLHVDHVGWNTRLDNGRWVPTFPKARYVFGKTEYDFWEASEAQTPSPIFADSVLPVVEAGRVDFVASDHAIDDHVRLFPTPGHTIGHVAVSLGRAREDAVMTGDAIHSPLQLRYPDMSPRFDVDPLAAATTRRALLERVCENGALCCTAHFPSPSGGRIFREGDGFRCEPIA